MRTIGYVRVSTDKQADRGISLESQQERIEKYCDLYNLDLVGIEIDAGESACKLERPALRRALRRLEIGDAEALIVIKLDRLTRSVRDLADLMDRYFQKDFALISVTESLDTSSATGRMVVNIIAAISQWEREIIGERTSAALAHLRGQGRYTGGAIRYGYTLGGDGTTLEPEPEEQNVIDLARACLNGGFGLRATARKINELGLRGRNGGPFQPAQIKKMIA